LSVISEIMRMLRKPPKPVAERWRGSSKTQFTKIFTLGKLSIICICSICNARDHDWEALDYCESVRRLPQQVFNSSKAGPYCYLTIPLLCGNCFKHLQIFAILSAGSCLSEWVLRWETVNGS